MDGPASPRSMTLPEGVDVAVLAIPGPAVLDSVRALARRKAGAAIIFSAGFAEGGDEGLAAQARDRRDRAPVGHGDRGAQLPGHGQFPRRHSADLRRNSARPAPCGPQYRAGVAIGRDGHRRDHDPDRQGPRPLLFHLDRERGSIGRRGLRRADAGRCRHADHRHDRGAVPRSGALPVAGAARG